MKIFYRIVIGTCLILLLILKTGQFMYSKFFSFEPTFDLLPDATEYSVSFNPMKIPEISFLKLKYNILNASRLIAKHDFTLDFNLPEQIFGQAECKDKSLSYFTILPNTKPSQIKLRSNHKLIQQNQAIYILDQNCELEFNNPIPYKDLISNVSKSKWAYVFVNQNYVNQNLDFFEIQSPIIASLNKYQENFILNSFALHSNQNLSNLNQSLNSQDIKCLNSKDNYLSVKQIHNFIDQALLEKVEFLENFTDNFQLNFSNPISFCNNENSFQINQNPDLEVIKQELPDQSVAKYFNVDLNKIFTSQPIANQESFYNPSLLNISDIFLQYHFPVFKTQTYFNFLSDSFNAITIIYE